jgi:hypothetical protein
MKFTHVLPLAALSTAFVLPSQETLASIQIEDNHRGNGVYDEVVATKNEVLESFKKHFEDVTETTQDAWHKVAETSRHALDEAFSKASEVNDKVHESAFDAQSWIDSEISSFGEAFDGPPRPPHHDDPHHGPPHHDDPHHGPPHHGPHHDKPNDTVYGLINSSKYTTKLAELINEFPDLVKELNSTKANYVCPLDNSAQ